MVFFTCQHCGDSLKKAAIENHYKFQCRTQPYLTCVDCLKDFKGKEYIQHTECVSELERYSAKGFVPKANKQQLKQMEWAGIVNVVLETEDLLPEHKKLLQLCSNHPNVPQKKAKFMNFIFSTTNRKCNPDIVNSLFDILAAKFKQITEKNRANKQINGKLDKLQPNNVKKTLDEDNSQLQVKREIKDDYGIVNNVEAVNNKTDKKSPKKQKRKNENEIEETSKEKIQKLDSSTSNDEELKSNRFSWSSTIIEILEKHIDKEIKLNKLYKKVIGKYETACKTDETDDKLLNKFNKKIKKTAGIEILKDRVRLMGK